MQELQLLITEERGGGGVQKGLDYGWLSSLADTFMK